MWTAQDVDSFELVIDCPSGDKCLLKRCFVLLNLAHGIASARYLSLGGGKLQFRASTAR